MNKFFTQQLRVIAVGMSTAGLFTAPAMATEPGGNSYAPGAETNMAGFMAPEGLAAYFATTRYVADRLKDNSGNDSKGLNDYKLKVTTAAFGLSYVHPNMKWLGANVETRVGFLATSTDLAVGIKIPGPVGNLTKSDSLTEVAYLLFTPVVFGWHGTEFHQSVGLEFIKPIVSYDPKQLVHSAQNYLQTAPFYGVTWMPKAPYYGSAKVRVGINDSNASTNYRSGNEFTLEYSTGYRVSPDVTFGVNGYFFRQLTDDIKNDVAVNGDGNRGSVNGLGPFVTYRVSPKVVVMAKLMTEFGTTNRPEGTRLWLQTKIPF